VINDRCYQLNFTNEGGVGGTTRLLKNIPGLWLVQECRRIWKLQGRDYGFEDLIRKAGEAPPLEILINPDHPTFVAPHDMPQAIRQFCELSGQAAPAGEGATIRCALESIALRYRMVLGFLEELVGGRLDIIHIVGGGAQNKLLCQMTADCTGRRVIAGPVEATALGNLAMQAIAQGLVANIKEARSLIRASLGVQEYFPRPRDPWDEAFERFEKLVAGS
jgi:rhamnulokinase